MADMQILVPSLSPLRRRRIGPKSECWAPNRHVGRTWLLISCSTSWSGPLVIFRGRSVRGLFPTKNYWTTTKHLRFGSRMQISGSFPMTDPFFIFFFAPFCLRPFTRFTIHRIGLFVHLQMVNDLLLYWATNQLSDFNHLLAESCQLR